MTAQPPPDFFPWLEVARFLESGNAFRLTHPGSPHIEIFGDSGGAVFGFRVDTQLPEQLPVSPLSVVAVRAVTVGTMDLLEVMTADRRLYEDFHALAALFVQRVRMQGMQPLVALDDVLASLARLIARTAVITPERQVGLYGELWTVLAFAAEVGVATAVACWTGPDHEEHDLVLEDVDVEVKTTRTDRASHVIHGLNQLEPKPGRALYLLSIRLTAGGGGGTSLPDVIARARKRAEAGGAACLTRLERGLEQSGWRDEYAPFCLDTYLLRGVPQLVPSTELPALTPSVLGLSPDDLSRLSDVQYRIDVTGRGLPVDDPGARAVLTLHLEP